MNEQTRIQIASDWRGPGAVVATFACPLVFALAAFLGIGAPAASAAIDACPNAAVRAQQGAQYLPDCRAYEQISPTEKFGYSVGGSTSPALQLGVAADGESLTYDSRFPLPGAEAPGYSGFLATRDAAGWLSSGLPMAHGPNSIGRGQLAAADVMLRGTTPDQRTSVYWDCTTEPYGALYIRRGDGSRQRIADATQAASCPAVAPSPATQQPWFLGISPDGRHVVFNSPSRLGPAIGIPGTGRILYEWVDDGGEGTLRVVNRGNEDPVALLSVGHASLGGGVPLAAGSQGSTLRPEGLRNAISDGADGHSRIFFQNPAPANVNVGGGPLYMRTDGATTTQISSPEAGYTPTEAVTSTGTRYIDAARNGSVVFFWANGDLTPGAPITGGVYRYETATGDLSWVDDAPTGGATTGMADDDGSHLYYLGTDLSNGNLHLYSNGTIIPLGFSVGAEAPDGAGNWQTNSFAIRSTFCVSADVSPDGRFFAFQTGGASQVYLYDAEANGGAGEVIHVSTSPMAPLVYTAGFIAACNFQQATGRAIEKRVMSDDGHYVFFDTAAALVPEDSNGLMDAYRWHDGTVDLVSSGAGAPASFQGTDASGANAFLVTRDRLAPSDGDALVDLYDARVGGGYLAPPAPPQCSGEACQGSPAPPPGQSGVGTAAVQGSGNSQDRKKAKKSQPKQHRKAKKQHRKARKQEQGSLRRSAK